MMTMMIITKFISMEMNGGQLIELRRVDKRDNATANKQQEQRMLKRSIVCYRLVGLVVKASASRAGGPGFESRLRRDFFGVESYQ